MGQFDAAFLEHLRDLRFTGSVRAVPEAPVVFPDRPLLEVTAPGGFMTTHAASGTGLRTPWPQSGAPAEYTLAGRTVLLAAERSPAAIAAARVCADLAERCGAQPTMLNVETSFQHAAPPPITTMVQAADAILGDLSHEARLQELRLALGDERGRVPDWPGRIMIGAAAESIVREARRVDAALIVLGIRPHDSPARPFTDGTTLRVMQHAVQPVLGVTAGTAHAPRRIIVGVGFGNASVRAARAALALLGGAGTLVLANVDWRSDVHGEDETGHQVIHELGVDAAFARLRAVLAPPPAVTVETVTLDGTPAAELQELAQRSGADAIAVGSQRHGRVERWLLGSVTSDLARDGRHSLLVVPPAS